MYASLQHHGTILIVRLDFKKKKKEKFILICKALFFVCVFFFLLFCFVCGCITFVLGILVFVCGFLVNHSETQNSCCFP
jgi:hypothetical protein